MDSQLQSLLTDKLVLERLSREVISLMGKENKNRNRLLPDETDGLIPRSFRYIWQHIMNKKEKVFLKASFLEIYNEQITDLLSDKQKFLHCRWNVESVMS